MSSLDVKGDLHGYLRGARETLVWKLEGLGEYDIRRTLTLRPAQTCSVSSSTAQAPISATSATCSVALTTCRFHGCRTTRSPMRTCGHSLTRRSSASSRCTRALGNWPTRRSTTSRSTRSGGCHGGQTAPSRSITFSSMSLAHAVQSDRGRSSSRQMATDNWGCLARGTVPAIGGTASSSGHCTVRAA